MSTVDKLNKALESKNAIKEVLETPYNVFRDYPDLIKKYVDNQPTKKVTDGTCNNAVDLPVKTIEVDGNSYKKTYEVYNLFNFKDIVIKQNVTVDENGFFTVTYDNSNGTSIKYIQVFPTKNLDLKTNTQYSIITEIKNVNGNGMLYSSSTLSQSGGQIISNANYLFSSLSNGKIEKTVGTSRQSFEGVVNGIRTFVQFDAGQSGSITFRISILENIDISVDNFNYEPYIGGIPSPNPDYPSEIETVGSNVNELKLKNGKSIKAYGLDVSIDNGIITINGTANGFYPTFLISGDGEIETRSGAPNIDANPNWYNSIALAKRDYTLKFEYISGDGGNEHRPYVFIHTSDGKNLEFSQGNSTKVKNYTGEIDGISFYVEKNQTYNNYKFRVYVVKGTYTKDTIPPYSPYGNIGLEQSGKNKFDSSIFKTIVKDGVTLTNENGIITLNGTYTGTKDWNYIFNIPTLNGEYILSMNQISGSQTLTGANGIRFTLWEQDYSNVWVSLESKLLNKTVKGHDYIRASLIVFPGTSFNNLKINLQVEEGTIATAYEPYHEPKIIPIDLQGNTLAKVGDVKDILKINRNGEVEIEKNIGKLVLTGEENWIYDSVYKYFRCPSYTFDRGIPDGSKKGLEAQKSNYFEITSDWGTTFRDNINKNIMFGVSDAGYKICIRNVNCTTVEDFKAWLKAQYDNGSPVITYYKLAESQIIKLPSIEPITLWQGTNIFKLISNLETDFEVEYVVDKESVLDEIQAAMLEAEIEI